jgi:predicted RNA-binding Zn ribbon-like protein
MIVSTVKTMIPTPHRFQAHDLIGGHLALTLVNTVTARDSIPHDWLATFDGLLQWAGLTGSFTARDLAALARQAAASPAAARQALGRCRTLREALHGTLEPLMQARAVPVPVLQQLDRLRLAAARRCALQARPGAVAASPTLTGSGLDLVADTVLAEALRLLEAPDLQRLRVCGGTHCGWLFLDQSKAGRRRWCDMATCGAAHKAERFRQRAALNPSPRAPTQKGSP